MMNHEDKFKLQYESLQDTFKGYVENVMKTLASIVVAIGWILTSDKSRDFLSMQRTAYVWVLVAIIVMSILHAVVSVNYYFRSQKKIALLEDLDYVERAYYGELQNNCLDYRCESSDESLPIHCTFHDDIQASMSDVVYNSSYPFGAR